MNKPKFIVPILLLGLLVLVGVSCIPTGKYSSPEKTVETMVKAMEVGDVDAYLDCMTDESQEWFESISKISPEGLTSESLKSQSTDYDPSRLKVTDKTKDSAVMVEEGQEVGLVFKKEKGNWKVDIIATMQEMFKGFEPEE